MSWPFLNMKKKSDCEAIDEKRKTAENLEDPELSYMDSYTKFEDVPLNMRAPVRETMFYQHYDESVLAELPKCLRVMPHH